MKYKSFTLENYKGIKKVSINLKEGFPHCLIGSNESGKTTLLKGIQQTGRLCKGEKIKNLNRIKPKGTRFSEAIRFVAELTVDQKDNMGHGSKPVELRISFLYHFKESLYQQGEDKTFVEVKMKANGEFEQARDSHIEKYLDAVKELAPDMLYYDDFLLEIPDKVYFARAGIGWERQGGILDHIPSFNGDTEAFEVNRNWQLIFEDIFRESQNGKDPNREPVSFHNMVVAWKGDEGTKNTRINVMEKVLDREISKISQDLSSNSFTFQNFRIKETKEDQYKTYELLIEGKDRILYKISERSKGYKCFFSFLVATLFRKNSNPNTLFLLDEPASNLHTRTHDNIIKQLSDLAKSSSVIYATHLPDVIDVENLNNTWLMQNEVEEEKVEGSNISCTPALQLDQCTDKEKLTRNAKPLIDKIAFQFGKNKEKLNLDQVKKIFDAFSKPILKETLGHIWNSTLNWFST
ncbi:MAG: AAA family ATPase [Cytophagales bacterium]|nr:AAA family ATPase [Cytophagales bacterium]